MTPVAKIVAHTPLATRKFMMSTAGSMRPPMSKVRATPGPAFGMVAEGLGRPGRHAVAGRAADAGRRLGRRGGAGRRRRRDGGDARVAAHDEHPARLDDVRVARQRRVAVRVPGLELLASWSRRRGRSPRASRRAGRCTSSRSAASPRAAIGSETPERSAVALGSDEGDAGWREGRHRGAVDGEAGRGRAGAEDEQQRRSRPEARRDDASV